MYRVMGRIVNKALLEFMELWNVSWQASDNSEGRRYGLNSTNLNYHPEICCDDVQHVEAHRYLKLPRSDIFCTSHGMKDLDHSVWDGVTFLTL